MLQHMPPLLYMPPSLLYLVVVTLSCLQANPSSLDKVEDLVDLIHLNESSTLHVLRQRYGSSLIHTFAGSHLIVLNPLRALSSYVDRVSGREVVCVCVCVCVCSVEVCVVWREWVLCGAME